MTTGNFSEQQTVPSAKADRGTATDTGMEVQATWNNGGEDPDFETGIGSPAPAPVSANPHHWIKWSRKAKYAVAAASLVSLAFGFGVGAWERKNQKIIANQASISANQTIAMLVTCPTSTSTKSSKSNRKRPRLSKSSKIPSVPVSSFQYFRFTQTQLRGCVSVILSKLSPTVCNFLRCSCSSAQPNLV